MTGRQTNTAAALIGLSPLLYIVPGTQAEALGGCAWLGGIAALPVLALLALLLQKRTPRAPGRLLSTAAAVWLLFGAACVLHGCAVRYCTAVGVFRTPAPYAALLLLTALPAALSRKKALFRASEIFLPVVLALLAVLLLCAATQLRPARLIDLTQLSAQGVLRAAVPVVVVGAAASVLPRCYAEVSPGAAPAILLGGLTAVLSAASVSVLGAPMTAGLELPVFTMLRNIGLLHTIERLDALMAAVWVLPDVTMLALLLRAGGDAAARALHIPSERAPTIAAAVIAAGGAALIQAQGHGFLDRLAPLLMISTAAAAVIGILRK